MPSLALAIVSTLSVQLSSVNGLLQTAGSVSAEEAKKHAETEFEKYRIIQDRLFQSDFDKFLGELPLLDNNDDS